MKINQNGRSMVEMLGVLAIIGVLSIGAVTGYSNAMNKYKTNKFLEQISQIAANIKTVYSAEKSGRISWEVLEKLKTVSNKKHFWGFDIYIGTPWKRYYLESGVTTTYFDDIFYISTTKLPTEVCVAVLTADWGTDLFGMGATYLGGSPDAPQFAEQAPDENHAVNGDKNYPAPFTLERAQKVCSENNIGSGATVYLYFKL